MFDAAYPRTLRAYIVYREQHRRLRNDRRTLVDVEASIERIPAQDDWRVNANANQGYSLGGLILNVSGKMIANYWLNHVYPPEVGAAHRSAAIHIHDLDMLAGYCAGWSLRTLLNEGLNGVPGKVESGPPKHMSSAVGQIVNFLGTLQNEWAGAQAFSSFDTYMAPYIRNDAMSYAQVRQCVQELIYNLNVPSRWGTQTPFTNLTFDWVCPEDLRDQVPVIAGQEVGFTYGELQGEMDMINRAYIEVMMAGDAKGRVFTFPIPTYNITEDFDWYSPNAERLFEMTARYGLPYFQNFVNSELKPNMIRSMCCRLQLDLRELLKRGNGLFGSAEQTGSLGVVTINCARLGYRHRGRRGRPDGRARHPARTWARQPGDQAQGDTAPHGQRPVPLHPALPGYAAQPFLDAGRERHQRDDPQLHARRARHQHRLRAMRFALRLLDHVRARMLEFQDQTGHMYNLEATPAEGTTYRFAKEDAAPVPGHPAGRHAGHALLHQLQPVAGGLYRRSRSRRWKCRMTCSASTPAAPCCTCT